MKTIVVAISTLFFLLASSSAHAEKAAVLIPDAEARIDAKLVELTQWLIADWFKERGVEQLMPSDAAPHLSSELKKCRSTDCALRYLDDLKSADYAVVTRIDRSGQDHGAEIDIVLVNRDGQRFSQSWPIGEAIELAVDAALTHAYTAFLMSQSKTSESTEVEVQEIELDARPQTETNANTDPVEIDPDSDQAESHSSIWNYIIGGSLLAGSVPLLVGSIYWAARNDDCIEMDERGNCIRYYFTPVNIVAISVGAALLLSGAFLILFEPITVEGELSVGNGQGSIRLRGSF